MEGHGFSTSPGNLPGALPDNLQGYIATLERRVREFTFLNEVSRKLLSSYDVDGVLKEALEMALVLTRSEGGCIAILDKTTDKIGEIIWAGHVYLSLKQFLSTEKAFFRNFAAYGGIAEVKPGDPVLSRFQQFQPSIRSALALPLQERGQVLGVIMVMHLHDKETDHGVIYDAEDMRTLDLFGQQAAMLIEHTKLKYDAGKMFAYWQALAALVTALEAKDVYTENHSRRVARISKGLGKGLGMPDNQVEEIYFGALLHDIGKIGVPETVLNKDSRLSDRELSDIRKHPLIGSKILGSLDFYPEVLNIVKHHHERYDGLGYPHGLKGKNIPVSARIVGLADAWDAMTSDRVYRKALAVETAVAEIQKGAGNQFDPGIADVFLEQVAKGSDFLF